MGSSEPTSKGEEMSVFYYTDHVDTPGSSVFTELFYDKVSARVFLVFRDTNRVHSYPLASHRWEDFKAAPSKGQWYNSAVRSPFGVLAGAGHPEGHRDNLNFYVRDARPTEKDLDFSSAVEVSATGAGKVQVSDNTNTGNSTGAHIHYEPAPTVEHALDDPEVKESGFEFRTQVDYRFTVDNRSAERVFYSNAEEPLGAVDDLVSSAERLGLKVIVHRVVFTPNA